MSLFNKESLFVAKLRKVESNTKKLVCFYCRDGVTSRFLSQSYEISERNEKKNTFSFYFRTKSKFGEAKVTEKLMIYEQR